MGTVPTLQSNVLYFFRVIQARHRPAVIFFFFFSKRCTLSLTNHHYVVFENVSDQVVSLRLFISCTFSFAFETSSSQVHMK